MKYLNCAIKCILRTILIIMLSSNISYLFSVIKDLSCNCTAKAASKANQSKEKHGFLLISFPKKRNSDKNGIMGNFKVNLAEANK